MKHKHSSLKPGLLSVPHLAAAFKKFNWVIDGAPDYDGLAQKAMDLYESDQGEKGIDRVEFGYMVAKMIGKYNLNQDCGFCLKATRENIDDFYEYVDCDRDSLIDAEELHK